MLKKENKRKFYIAFFKKNVSAHKILDFVTRNSFKKKNLVFLEFFLQKALLFVQRTEGSLVQKAKLFGSKNRRFFEKNVVFFYNRRFFSCAFTKIGSSKTFGF
jgi:hypothetical protein